MRSELRLANPNQRRRWRARDPEDKPAEVFPRRFFLLKSLMLLLFGLLLLQLARMQLIEHEAYQQRAESNRLRIVPDLPARGLIYDRNGEQLVQNVPIYSAGVVAADVPGDKFLVVIDELSRETGVPAADIATKVAQARNSDDPFTPVIIKAGLDESTLFRLRERQAQLPGVQVLAESVRNYATGALTADVLGYVGRIDQDEYARLHESGYQLNDRLGKTGVELTYEQALRGTAGYRQVEIDAAGQELRTIRSSPPGNAGNLVLSLDLDLQRQVTEYLMTAMAESGSQNAAAAVMDVRTGEMLSMVTLPAYDNNVLTEPVDQEALPSLVNDPAKPLVNRVLAEIYAPGSTFKMVTGTAALQEGVATPSTRITSRGAISVPNQYGGEPAVFRDWSALGTLDFYGGVRMSSDVYFYYLSGGFGDFRGLGAERLARYAREYGLGAPTGIDIPGEAAGLVPDPAWKEEAVGNPWYLGDTYTFGIGQGYLAVTPLQLLGVTTAVANGGDVLVPHVAREIVHEDGTVITRIERQVAHHVAVSDENLAVMREGMRQAAVSPGTAASGASRLVPIAGKTGTAEFGPKRADGKHDTHAWYTGFAPFDNPEISVVVFLQKGTGAGTAGPVAAQILDYYFARQRLAQEALP
ncbi:MAG: penicillin-binding protein 2 [Dehalococcoidia bacterium]